MNTSNIALEASAPSKTASSSMAKAVKTTTVAAHTASKAPARKVTSTPRPRPATKKAVAKTAQKVPAKTQASSMANDTSEDSKTKKPKLVRDGFTMPKNEYAVLDVLKLRAAKLGRPVKKSELLRAGVKALEAMSDAALTQALDNVPAIKTGRPKKD